MSFLKKPDLIKLIMFCFAEFTNRIRVFFFQWKKPMMLLRGTTAYSNNPRSL